MQGSEILARLRPCLPTSSDQAPSCSQQKACVLVVGTCLADKPNNAEAIITNLSDSDSYSVTHCWAALGSSLPNGRLLECLRLQTVLPIPKFTLINRLLESVNLSNYRYVLISDDDIHLPPHFLENFLNLQKSLDFRLAQPARTSASYIDHAIVEQRPEALARQTRFVECGPFVSAHESVYELLMPFESESPMGWGYENLWSYRLGTRGFKMGIIDAVPVGHWLRAPRSCYNAESAREDMDRLLQAYPHRNMLDCLQVVETIYRLPASTDLNPAPGASLCRVPNRLREKPSEN
jgi:hypothetical protein